MSKIPVKSEEKEAKGGNLFIACFPYKMSAPWGKDLAVLLRVSEEKPDSPDMASHLSLHAADSD